MSEDLFNTLSECFPELEFELQTWSKKTCPYQVCKLFADYTKRKASEGNLNLACRCLRVANEFLRNGNNSTKFAMENCYLFSLSQCAIFYTELKDRLPYELNRAYKQQIYSKGI